MSAISTPAQAFARRSPADRKMRRLLRLPVDGPPGSLTGAHTVVSRSIFISALRCTVTYLLIPILGPLLGLSSRVGPWLGLALSAVTVLAIVAATRRFFGADHKWRWKYAALASVILVFVAVQVVMDVRTILS